MRSVWLGPALLVLAALVIVGVLYYWDLTTTPQPSTQTYPAAAYGTTYQ